MKVQTNRCISVTTELYKAVLEGRKTVTRRLINPQPPAGWSRPTKPVHAEWIWSDPDKNWSSECRKPRYHPGDTLCFACAWATDKGYDIFKPSLLPDHARIEFLTGSAPVWCGKTRSSRFLPLRFRTLRRECVSVRPERLWDITEDEARLEGMIVTTNTMYPDRRIYTAAELFELTWERLHGRESWESNDWVWRVEWR